MRSGFIQSKIRQEIPLSADILGGVPYLKDLAGPLLEHVRNNIDSAVADKTIEKAQGALEEASSETDHSLWKSFDARLRVVQFDAPPQARCVKFRKLVVKLIAKMAASLVLWLPSSLSPVAKARLL